jgi:hypothetical protein
MNSDFRCPAVNSVRRHVAVAAGLAVVVVVWLCLDVRVGHPESTVQHCAVS